MLFGIVWVAVSALIAMIVIIVAFTTKDYERVSDLAFFAPIVFVAWPILLPLFIWLVLKTRRDGPIVLGGKLEDGYVPHFYS